MAAPQPVTQRAPNGDIIDSFVTNSSGNVAAAAATATLTSAAAKLAWITGFLITASGATGALVVLVTVTGVIGGTMTFVFTFPAGVAVAANPLAVNFPQPIPASGQNTNIVVSCPSGGSGNTNAAAVAMGFLSRGDTTIGT